MASTASNDFRAMGSIDSITFFAHDCFITGNFKFTRNPQGLVPSISEKSHFTSADASLGFWHMLSICQKACTVEVIDSLPMEFTLLQESSIKAKNRVYLGDERWQSA